MDTNRLSFLPGRRIAAATGLALSVSAIGGCARYAPLPLVSAAPLQAGVQSLSHPGYALPVRLALADVERLVLDNNPDLLAARTARLGAQADIQSAGIPPNPSLGAAYGFLLGGPGTTAAFSASISEDLRAIVSLSTRRRAANDVALQLDASLLWEEWQTLAAARLLVIDQVQGQRARLPLQQTADLLDDQLRRNQLALAAGDTSLQALTSDRLTAGDAQHQLDELDRLQDGRRRSLAALLGLTGDAVVPLADDIEPPAADEAELQRTLPKIGERRPDLIALRLGYQVQEDSVHTAILDQFPNLLLGIAGGQDNSDVRTLGPQITLDLPLFDRNQGVIAKARATRLQMHEEYSARLAAADGEIRSLLASQQQVRRQLAIRRPQLASLIKTVDLAEAAFRAGDLDRRSYIDLVVSRNSRQVDLLALEQIEWEQAVALATVSGAGLPPIQPPPPVATAAS